MKRKKFIFCYPLFAPPLAIFAFMGNYVYFRFFFYDLGLRKMLEIINEMINDLIKEHNLLILILLLAIIIVPFILICSTVWILQNLLWIRFVCADEEGLCWGRGLWIVKVPWPEVVDCWWEIYKGSEGYRILVIKTFKGNLRLDFLWWHRDKLYEFILQNLSRL